MKERILKVICDRTHALKLQRPNEQSRSLDDIQEEAKVNYLFLKLPTAP
jgi:hypothetical protein